MTESKWHAEHISSALVDRERGRQELFDRMLAMPVENLAMLQLDDWARLGPQLCTRFIRDRFGMGSIPSIELTSDLDRQSNMTRMRWRDRHARMIHATATLIDHIPIAISAAIVGISVGLVAMVVTLAGAHESPAVLDVIRRTWT